MALKKLLIFTVACNAERFIPGIPDMTHKRLFTFGSPLRTPRIRGFCIATVDRAPVPFTLVLGMAAARVLARLNRLLIRLCRGLFSCRIACAAVPRPMPGRLPQKVERY